MPNNDNALINSAHLAMLKAGIRSSKIKRFLSAALTAHLRRDSREVARLCDSAHRIAYGRAA